jgi:hypothetical protein
MATIKDLKAKLAEAEDRARQQARRRPAATRKQRRMREEDEENQGEDDEDDQDEVEEEPQKPKKKRQREVQKHEEQRQQRAKHEPTAVARATIEDVAAEVHELRALLQPSPFPLTNSEQNMNPQQLLEPPSKMCCQSARAPRSSPALPPSLSPTASKT